VPTRTDAHATALACLVALLCCTLIGCAGGGSDDDRRRGGGRGCKPPDPTTVSLASNIQPIYDRSCALSGCHVGAVPAGALDLSRGRAFDDTVGVPAVGSSLQLVRAGAPEDSYLVRKIEGGPDIAGELMPQGCPGRPLNGAVCLSADDIAAIRTWITECALDN
jgi:hypothetical protein